MKQAQIVSLIKGKLSVHVMGANALSRSDAILRETTPECFLHSPSGHTVLHGYTAFKGIHPQATLFTTIYKQPGAKHD